MKSSKLNVVLFVIGYAYSIAIEKIDFYRNKFDSFLIKRITEKRIKRFRGFDSVDDVFAAYMIARKSHDPVMISDELKVHIGNSELRTLLKMASKKD